MYSRLWWTKYPRGYKCRGERRREKHSCWLLEVCAERSVDITWSRDFGRDTRKTQVFHKSCYGTRVPFLTRRDVTTWSSMNTNSNCADLVEVDQGVSSCKIVNNPHSAFAAVVLGAGATNMMPRSLPTRRRLQMLALVIATAYATILLYQAIVPRQVIRVIIVVVVTSYTACTLCDIYHLVDPWSHLSPTNYYRIIIREFANAKRDRGPLSS